MKIQQIVTTTRSCGLPENPPTAYNLPSTTEAPTFARHVVMDGPGDQVQVSGSNTSVEHSDWVPSDPPMMNNLPATQEKIEQKEPSIN